MKAIVDEKIPFIRPAIESLMDEVIFLPGAGITPRDVKDADVLIVRTRTRCDKALLQGSSVRFVGTATIGFDHIDTAYMEEAGIRWTNCPGCNATSVAQYVASCMQILINNGKLVPAETTVGLVGAGHVGSAVQERLTGLGMQCLLCDPPRQHREGNPGGMFHTLEELQERCQVISFHTPLTRTGPWPTLHMADSRFFRALPQRPLIINTSRGEVVDNAALEDALAQGLIRQAIVDTWEGEPHISASLLQRVFIGTPHIAGYSADGKANATRMILEALCRWMHVEPRFSIAPPPLPASLIPAEDPAEQALQLYDPREDSERLKQHPECFEQLRNNYPLRREKFDCLKHA